ncbi:MAG TPA: helix-turn-helix domain-containing protein [Caulobacteraceae bacterium]|nr:helix-turn-helix domain-containing protein [Caulobacteraceae bacterium]
MPAKSLSFLRRTPQQARSRATVEAIVEAAAQILERRGPEGFTTSDVAERAGVSIGTLYQYFPDKQAILIAAARRELADAPPRRRALLAALIAWIERLGGPASAAASGSRCGAALQRRAAGLLERIAAPFAPAPLLTPIPIRLRARR